jgi:hypothetical protein
MESPMIFCCSQAGTPISRQQEQERVACPAFPFTPRISTGKALEQRQYFA